VRAFIVIFLLSFSIRVFFLAQIPQRHILPHDRWEDTAIATSLVERGEFADPYMVPTGPTAHLPPLVPGILALFWSLFGMGLAGGYAARLFSITAFSTLYALLPWFGGKFGLGRQAGVLGGIAGSLIVVMHPGNGEELAGICLGLLAIVFLRRWTSGLGSFGGSLLLGAACGVAFHLQPVLLSVVVGWMVFELWWSRDRRKWYLSGVMVLGMAVGCAPWAWRNYTALNAVYFIRSDLGLELRMGNSDGVVGNIEVMHISEFRHPRVHPVEAQLVLELGEAEYMRRARAEAVAWIGAHPGKFLALTVSRTTQFWLGPFDRPLTVLAVTGLTILALLGAWRSLPAMTTPQRAALMVPLICYPLVYYVVLYMPRYRVPLDWILLLLAGAAVWRWRWLEGFSAGRQRDRSSRESWKT
jgi:4-amino-4-deoxy-L-arabinose transferase-like glycosyltransferase